MLSDEEIRAIRLYEGDVEGDDPFWGDPKLYVTLNALFFPGVVTEEKRLLEGKPLNPAVAADMPRLFGVMAALFSAMQKYRAEPDCTLWRIERTADFDFMRREQATVSFTSTAQGGYCTDYCARRGLVLLEIERRVGTPCIPLARLPRYAKAQEQEVLLPPWLGFKLHREKLTPGERAMRDMDGAPPAGKFRLVMQQVKAPDWDPGQVPEDSTAENFLSLLVEGLPVQEAQIRDYCLWKMGLMHRLGQLWREVCGTAERSIS